MTEAGLRRAVVCVLVVDAIAMVTGAVGTSLSHEPAGLYLLSLFPLPLTLVGGVIAVRRPDNRVGWSFLVMSLLLATTGAMEGWLLAYRDTGPYTATPWIALVAKLVEGTIVLVPLGLLYFPDNQPPSPRWRWPIRFVVAAAGAAVITGLFSEQLGTEDSGLLHPNPLGFANDGIAGVGQVFGALALPVMLAIPVSLVLRWRRADVIERAQLKLVFLVAAVYTAVGLVGFTVLRGGPREVFSDVFFMSLYIVFPVTMAVAVLRYRLWDIDRVVSRTVSYSVLTAVIAAPYAVIVTVVTRVASSDLAVALATLAAAALFQPLRRRVQDRVDRRFNRAKFDAARAVESFRTQLRDNVELDVLRRDLLHVVRSTVQPTGTSLWLR